MQQGWSVLKVQCSTKQIQYITVQTLTAGGNRYVTCGSYFPLVSTIEDKYQALHTHSRNTYALHQSCELKPGTWLISQIVIFII